MQTEELYEGLENMNQKSTKDWLDEQRLRSAQYFSGINEREEFRSSLSNHMKYVRYMVPKKIGGRLFFEKAEEYDHQPRLYMRKDYEGETSLLIDPNSLSKEATLSITNYYPSHCGKYVAYTLSLDGSDWQQIRVLATDTMLEDDPIEGVRFTHIAWAPDSSGFYYAGYGRELEENQRESPGIYFHQLAQSYKEDRIVFSDPEENHYHYQPFLSDDHRFIYLYKNQGTSVKNGFLVKDLHHSDQEFQEIFPVGTAEIRYVSNVGHRFLFLTDLDADKKRIIEFSIDRPEETLVEIIPELQSPILRADMVHHKILLTVMKDCYHEVFIYSREGEYLNKLDLPSYSSVSEISGKRNHSTLYLGLESFLSPLKVYKVDLSSNLQTLLCQSKTIFDEEEYLVDQVFVKSKDETEIPMFLIKGKNIPEREFMPTILYGYGGFNISLTPKYQPWFLPWLENGGLIAVANLRGGGEYGDNWHRMGMLEQKQNVFDDYIACGEWLVNHSYTRRDKLALYGRSNGGLLVAATMIQRPDLAGAVICSVPVLDMMRYHKFTIGHYWIPEYGNPDDPGDAEYLKRYSPLHNVKPKNAYPPILVSTAKGDNRVVPAHGMKFAAKLQENHRAVFRLEDQAGHGHGKPVYKTVEEWTDFYSFLWKELEMGDF